MLKGYRKGQRSWDSVRSISFEVLSSVPGRLTQVCSSVFEVLLFKAVFQVAFFGALRISESYLVHHGKLWGDLLFRDVTCSNSVVKL